MRQLEDPLVCCFIEVGKGNGATSKHSIHIGPLHINLTLDWIATDNVSPQDPKVAAVMPTNLHGWKVMDVVRTNQKCKWRLAPIVGIIGAF
jgi:hypothetical protein